MKSKSFICLFISNLLFMVDGTVETLKSAVPITFEQPNVVIFLADDLGYGDLSLSGHPTSRTRNIDKLARNGKFLTNFYVPSAYCSPSRASLLTGRYHIRTGIYPTVFYPDSIYGLPQNETTIAKIMKNLGYSTKIIGKWHLGVGAEREFLPGEGSFGFDSYFGIPYSHDMCPCPVCYPGNDSCWIGSGCMLDEIVSCPLFSNKVIVEQPVQLLSLPQRYLDEALKFITKSSSNGIPFFLYMAFPQIHVPQFASSKFASRSPRGQVGDSLLEMDWMVGEIMELIDRLKLSNKTMTWFTSDNGPDLKFSVHGGDAGLLRCGKGTTWNGGVQVPSIIHWPARILPSKSNALVAILDILPTISTITGGQFGNLTLDGVDVSTVLFDKTGQSPREFFAIYPEKPSSERGPYAVIFNHYKAHYYTIGNSHSNDNNYDEICTAAHEETKHGPPLLFDIFKDPGERYNLGNQSEYSAILLTIDQWRRKHMAEVQWMKPLTSVLDKRVQPCCTNSSCELFPQCCDCPKT